eukprot:11025434-Prorocentrum_lima.AAC.1
MGPWDQGHTTTVTSASGSSSGALDQCLHPLSDLDATRPSASCDPLVESRQHPLPSAASCNTVTIEI